MSKSVLLRGLLLRAWRERWTECQWGLNIKKILPRGVSGDAYNLADCILEQAVIGGANQVIISYLRHSLCSHLVSYAAVLKWISNYNPPESHSHLLLSILKFIDSIIPAVACNNRQEENQMVEACNGLIRWLGNVYIRMYPDTQIMEQLGHVLEKITNNEFMLGILCIAKVDNPLPMREVGECISKRTQYATAIELKNVRYFQRLLDLHVEDLEMDGIEPKVSPAITYILQPLLVVELLNNASNDTRIVSQLLLVQRLKRFSRPQFFCEILRGCLLTLQNVIGTPRAALWCAFTFIKVPQIFLKLGLGRKESEMEVDSNGDLLEAIDLLLEETSLLDILDFKCGLNTVECLMKEFQKHNLVTDKHTEHYAAKREVISANVQKLDTSNQSPSIVKFVIRAEQPLSGILKTLSTDYNKVQEALPGLLFQILHGNSLDLILSVATVEGKLKTFVSRLIKCNECSKQVVGETGKPAITRAALFDVTFLILAYIVQTYGSEILLEQTNDSFFENWCRTSMVDRRKPKSALAIAKNCDQAKVDELLVFLIAQGHGGSTNLKWHEVAENIPGMLYQVLLAWDNGISSMDVKVVLDNLKSKMGVYSVCAASWLCSYVYSITEDEHHKPMTMIKQLLASGEDSAQPTENMKERLGLTNKIILRMQNENQPRSTSKMDCNDVHVVSAGPLEECFTEAWAEISDRKWLSVDVAQKLEGLLYESCGAYWLVRRLVNELDNCKYVAEMDQVTDIAFSIMHLDIEATTIALISELLPVFLSSEITHPYATAVARFSAYAVLSAVEKNQQDSLSKKKRNRMESDEGKGMEPTTKMRKLDMDLMDDLTGRMDSSESSSSSGQTNSNIRDPLGCAIKEMFRLFAQHVATDEFSPRVQFIFEFLTILVECNQKKSRPCVAANLEVLDAAPILRLIPSGFLQNLLKVMPLASIKPGLVLQMYDLTMSSGRQAALSDLCVLKRNVQVNLESIKL